ncbi:MAG: glycosyltransferase [Steroidobacteraceae bacterium]|jgi:GT2 family glycosyltransferase
MSSKPIASDLTVIIPTLGRACLRESMRAIADGTVWPAKIVLAHQGTAGELDSMLREFAQWGLSVHYVQSDKRSCGSGRNTAIEQVRTTFFASTDDDCLVDAHWVEEVRAALARHPREIVSGRVLASEPGAPSSVTIDEPRLFTRMPLKGNHFTGGNFGVALQIFQDVGPFDERPLVRFCEDNEWSYRALAKGYHCRYLPEITITHLHWRGNKEMERVYADYARSQGGWIGRKLREGDWSFLIRLAYESSRGAKRWLLGSLRRDFNRKIHGRAFVVDMMRGVVIGWNERSAGAPQPGERPAA